MLYRREERRAMRPEPEFLLGFCPSVMADATYSCSWDTLFRGRTAQAHTMFAELSLMCPSLGQRGEAHLDLKWTSCVTLGYEEELISHTSLDSSASSRRALRRWLCLCPHCSLHVSLLGDRHHSGWVCLQVTAGQAQLPSHLPEVRPHRARPWKPLFLGLGDKWECTQGEGAFGRDKY